MLVNEWRYLLKQPLFWVCFLVPVLLTVILSGGIEPDDVDVIKQTIYLDTAIIMLTLPILCGLLANTVYNRDKYHNMAELIQATPRSLKTLNTYRFKLLTSALLFIYFACFTAVKIMTSLVTAESVFAVLMVFTFLISVPAIAFFSAIALWLSQRLSSAISMYIVFALILVIYVLFASFTGSPLLSGSEVKPGVLAFMLWFDPLGVTPLTESYSTTGHLIIESTFATNRLIFVILSLALFRLVADKEFKPKVLKSSQGSIKESNDTSWQHQFINVSSIKQNPLSKSRMIRILSHHWIVILIRQPYALLILLLVPLITFSEVASSLLPLGSTQLSNITSADVLNAAIFDNAMILASLAALLWAYQLGWHANGHQFCDILAATPVKNAMNISSKLVSLLFMVILLFLTIVIACLAAEVFLGSSTKLQDYLNHISLAFLPVSLVCVLFVTVNELIKSPLKATVINGLILAAKFSPLMAVLGIAHPLWDIAGTPLTSSDAFWQFEASISAYSPFVVFWTLICALVLFLSMKLSHRGTRRQILAKSKIHQFSGVASLAGLALVISMHSIIDADASSTSAMDMQNWQVDYEKRYGDWVNTPQPTLVSIESSVDIFPKDGKAHIALHYQLKNKTATDIDRVLVSGVASQKYDDVTFSDAELLDFDEGLNQRIFALNDPMQPGEFRELAVTFVYRQPKLSVAKLHGVVSDSFSNIEGSGLIPHIGFNPQWIAKHHRVRRAEQLSDLIALPPSESFQDPEFERTMDDKVKVGSTMSVPITYTAITQGDLVKSWVEGNINYSRFESQSAIKADLSWLAVPGNGYQDSYESIKFAIHGDVTGSGLDTHVQAVHDTLSWFEQLSVKSPFDNLHLVSTPDFGYTSHSVPGVVYLNHANMVRLEPKKETVVDPRYRRSVYELAKQWLGHDIGYGQPKDWNFITASLTKYVEILLIEQRYGKDAAKSLIMSDLERYRLARVQSQSPAETLINARRSFTLYEGALLAFSKLRMTVGDQAIQNAIVELFEMQKRTGLKVHSMDFVTLLKKYAPTEAHSDINDMLLSPLILESFDDLKGI